MNTFKKDILETFQKLAKKLNLIVCEPLDSFVEIIGAEIGLRIRWKIDRIEGVFVTLFRVAEPNNEYSITYLIEYEEGSAQEIESTKANDTNKMLMLVEKYATALLLGTSEKFSAFEKYARRRVLEQMPKTPEIKATRWIRPEWI